MNWVSELSDLYDKNAGIAGEIVNRSSGGEDDKNEAPLVLLPIFHSTAAAQIEVTISDKGEFLSAEEVPKNNKLTIIPVTEESASRASGIAPHPLCDTLEYLAGDYAQYFKGKYDANKHKLYMEGLAKWVNSEHSHEKVEAIYAYLRRGCLMADLIDAGVLKLNDDGTLSDAKIMDLGQEKAFVRFIVYGEAGENILEDKTGKYFKECWLDRTLQQSFINYCRSAFNQRGMCYLTGDVDTPITFLHPRKIRNEGDMAKLISANDSTNFTYRGRFKNREEAFNIGYETSQKAHNALKWIIRKQGSRFGELTVAAWESSLMPLPSWIGDTQTTVDEAASSMNDNGVYDTNQAEAERLKEVLYKLEQKLPTDSRMVLIALEAATPGRLAMVEFKSLDSSCYLQNLNYWHQSCRWLQLKYKDKGLYYYEGIAGVYDIANLLYATEKNGMLTLSDTDARMYGMAVKRLLPCIWDRRAVPDDMVELAFIKACSPQCYTNRYNWEKVLCLACSFIKKQRYEKFKEVWNLGVDRNCKDRSYLYGRLLAVAERVEYKTYERGEERETNAMRLMSAFSNNPQMIWKIIEESITPYWPKLRGGERYNCRKTMDEICSTFESVEDFQSNEKLSGLYLLGFHCQSYELRNNKQKETEEDGDE